MKRKAIIIILTTLAAGTGGLWLASWLTWVSAGRCVTDHHWLAFWVANGHLTVSSFVTSNPQDIQIIQRGEAHRRKVYRNARKSIWSDLDLSDFLDLKRSSYWFDWKRPSGTWVVIEKGGKQTVLTSSHATNIGFRLNLPFVLFAFYPTVAFIRGPLRRHRRRKRNQCIHCGYNLTGLTEPRCPECGKAVGTKLEAGPSDG